MGPCGVGRGGPCVAVVGMSGRWPSNAPPPSDPATGWQWMFHAGRLRLRVAAASLETFVEPGVVMGHLNPDAGGGTSAHDSQRSVKSIQLKTAGCLTYGEEELTKVPEGEEPPTTWGTSALYAWEGGNPEARVDVVHEDGNEWKKPWFSFRTLLSYTGPGFLMCIAYLDPGNLEADLQVGAYTGYSLIWVLFLATAMGLVLQCMAARLGVVTGKDLANICRQEYSRHTSMILWIMTEIAIIGCDLQEIIGSAVAFQILFGLPLWAGCLITFADTFTFLAIHYFGVRKLEALFVVLVATMTVCFFINFAEQPPPARSILEGFKPSIQRYAVKSAVGLTGAVIMPHNLYLHSALVLSRRVDRSKPSQVTEANRYFAIDSTLALIVSFFINLAVVSVFSFHFFSPTCASQPSGPTACLPPGLTGQGAGDGAVSCVMASGGNGVCQEIGLAHADQALEHALNSAARYVWGVGLLAAGQSSTMTGTYAGQYVMEGFLHLKIPIWMRVTLTRLVAIGPALIVAICTQDNQSLSDSFQEWINVLQSVQLTFALLPVLHFTSSTRIMGRYVNNRFTALPVGLLAIAVMLVNAYLVTTAVAAFDTWWAYGIVAVVGVLYFYFAYTLVFEDIKVALRFLCNGTADPECLKASPTPKHQLSLLSTDGDAEKSGEVEWVNSAT